MGTVDVVILVLVAVMAAIGYRQGFIIGVLSVGGFVLGAFLGSRLVPLVLPDGSESPYAPIGGLLGALLGGAILSTGFEGLGAALRGGLRGSRGLKAVDGMLGAALSAALGLAICWVAGAVALQTPGARELRRDIQRSEVLSRLNEVLPPSGPLLNALARFDPFPTLDGPSADVSAPKAAVARDPQIAAAADSVVRILGTACGLGQSGTGWVAGDGLVVTNAHVVAGEDDTTVQVEGRGPKFDARVVAFDPRNDVAVLRVENLQGVEALPLADEAPSGRDAAVLGFPRNGPYDVRAARLASTRTVLSQDAYGQGPVQRRITAFRALVRPGNSGGPVVDGRGRVVATVFATASRSSGPRTGYGVPNAVVRELLDGPLRPRSSGPCAP